MRVACTAAAMVAVMLVSISSAAYVCVYDYSSDDCSGDTRSVECWHDGECRDIGGGMGTSFIYMCEPSLAEYSVYSYSYDQGGSTCNGQSYNKTTYPAPGKCTSEGPGSGTFRYNCSLTNETTSQQLPKPAHNENWVSSFEQAIMLRGGQQSDPCTLCGYYCHTFIPKCPTRATCICKSDPSCTVCDCCKDNVPTPPPTPPPFPTLDAHSADPPS
jgi:hypothetical protein